MNNVLKPLVKSVSILLELTTAASAINATIYRKMFQSGRATLIIYNEEMNDIIKLVNSLQKSDLLIKGSAKQSKMKQKSKKEGFLERC